MEKKLILILFFILFGVIGSIYLYLSYNKHVALCGVNFSLNQYEEISLNSTLEGQFIEKGDIFNNGINYLLIVNASRLPNTNKSFENIMSKFCVATKSGDGWRETYLSKEYDLQFRDGSFKPVFRDLNGDNIYELLLIRDSGYAGFNSIFYGFFINDTQISEIEELKDIWGPFYDKEKNAVSSSFKSGPEIITEYYIWLNGKLIKKS